MPFASLAGRGLLGLNGLLLCKVGVEYLRGALPIYVPSRAHPASPAANPTLAGSFYDAESNCLSVNDVSQALIHLRAGLFQNTAFDGPGLGLLSPFLGYMYLTLSSLNLLAAATFGSFEAAAVLFISGLISHIGMGVARLQLTRIEFYREVPLRAYGYPARVPKLSCCDPCAPRGSETLPARSNLPSAVFASPAL